MLSFLELVQSDDEEAASRASAPFAHTWAQAALEMGASPENTMQTMYHVVALDTLHRRPELVGQISELADALQPVWTASFEKYSWAGPDILETVLMEMCIKPQAKERAVNVPEAMRAMDACLANRLRDFRSPPTQNALALMRELQPLSQDHAFEAFEVVDMRRDARALVLAQRVHASLQSLLEEAHARKIDPELVLDYIAGSVRQQMKMAAL